MPCCGMIVDLKHDSPFHFRGHELLGSDHGGFVLLWWDNYLLLIIIFPLVNS